MIEASSSGADRSVGDGDTTALTAGGRVLEAAEVFAAVQARFLTTRQSGHVRA